MTHEFDRAQVVHNDLGNWLCLHIKNAPMARVECEQLKEGKTYTAEVKKKYDKRSLDANAMYWKCRSVFTDGISKILETTKCCVCRHGQ